MKSTHSADSGRSHIAEQAPPERELDVLRAALSVLRDRLPAMWAVDAKINPPGRNSRADAELQIRAPDGTQITALVEAKRLLNTRDVPITLEHLRRVAADRGAPESVFMLVARYLAPATRDRIADAGASYVDTTGNVHLVSSRPALFLRDRGADRDPWRGPGRPRGTLQGPPAARVVRALIDFAPPYSVPDVAARAGASTGATYRVVNFLEEQQLVERESRGPLTVVHWRSLVERWSRDYGFAQSNTVATFLEPRGLSALTARLLDVPQLEYALTGSLAVEAVAAYAPARLAMLYVRDIGTAAEVLKLRPATAGANVALVAGNYDVAFDRVRIIDGLRLAALSQVAVDLLSGPGRNPSEAVALLDWMEHNEQAWRR